MGWSKVVGGYLSDAGKRGLTYGQKARLNRIGSDRELTKSENANATAHELRRQGIYSSHSSRKTMTSLMKNKKFY